MTVTRYLTWRIFRPIASMAASGGGVVAVSFRPSLADVKKGDKRSFNSFASLKINPHPHPSPYGPDIVHTGAYVIDNDIGVFTLENYFP